ncbi:phosphotransferase [Paenibacillus alginolyticus]|uniref:Phosphotransferase n=2 Tax=Paenibacillus alginolyticus TaxID=59839 RepID=A0ABT4GA52_9BACL|nr:phosphotransferase [Paenibacillus alginolyticus]MCY9693058.1 phosphotransferase [Paenibacillus alginolyticus]
MMSMMSQVEQMYGIKIKEALQIKDICQIRTTDGAYCLKSYAFPEEEVRFITRILSYMDERGFTRGQKIYPTVEQSPYMTYDSHFYTLTNWVDGERPDFTRRKDLKKGIRTLAKFHAIAEGFPIAEAPEARIRYSGLEHEITEYKTLLSSYKITEHLAALTEDVLDHLQQPKVIEAIDTEQRASAFVHGDYNYPNLMKDKRRKLHLIDFDNTSLHARMKDLSHILHRNALWDGTEMLRWVDYYQKYRPLSSSDLNLLHALLSAPYHVVRNIRIGGIRLAKEIIPTAAHLNKYQRELRALL